MSQPISVHDAMRVHPAMRRVAPVAAGFLLAALALAAFTVMPRSQSVFDVGPDTLFVAGGGAPPAPAPAPGLSTAASPPRGPTARFDIARDITVSLSALGAALFAILGVNAWHRQLKGTTEYQIALRVLKAVYAVRESVIEARGRVTFPLDGDAPGAGTKGREELNVLQDAQSYQRRLTRIGGARADLLLAQQEALALWGEGAKESLEDLTAAIGELFATYDQYFEGELERARREDREGAAIERDAETLVMNRILYSRPDTDGKDPFGRRIARAVTKAEEFYRDRLG